jgi:hypothetical protein
MHSLIMQCQRRTLPAYGCDHSRYGRADVTSARKRRYGFLHGEDNWIHLETFTESRVSTTISVTALEAYRI